MYRAIVASRIRKVFDAIGRRDIDYALKDARDDVHHIFPGDNALGGVEAAGAPPISE